MMSIRALSRIAFRPLCRSSAPLFRPVSSLSKTAIRAPSRWRPSPIISQSHFSTAPLRQIEDNDTDQLLSAKLNLETEIELQNQDSSKPSESIEKYLQESGFQIQDKPGSQFVTLTKEFEDELIKVEFSIADINSLSEEFDEEDTALEDEDLDPSTSSGGSPGRRNINQATPGGISVAPEDSVAPSDFAARGEEVPEEAGAESDEAGPSVPVNIQITISKPSQSQAGAMQIHAHADDGMITIDQVSNYPSVQLATASTSDAVKEAASLYTGPPFENLDAELCEAIERYIDERGIDAELAQFLPDYVEYKEQREYVQWLQNFKKFVDA